MWRTYWISAPFKNVTEKKNTLHLFKTSDETRNNFPGEVSESSFPGIYFESQPYTQHSWKIEKIK